MPLALARTLSARPRWLVGPLVAAAALLGAFAPRASAFDDHIYPHEFAITSVHATAFHATHPGQDVDGTEIPLPASGSHDDFKISVGFHVNNGQWGDFSNEDTAQQMTLRFPSYLIGDPNAATKCSGASFDNNACPADSSIGFIHADARARLPVVTLGFWAPLQVDGGIYNLQPEGMDLATFGIHLRYAAYNINAKVHVAIDNNDAHRIVATVDDIPNYESGAYFLMDHIDLVLYGMHGSRPFLTFPTRCDPWAKTEVQATAYDGRQDSTWDPLDRNGACNSFGQGRFTPHLMHWGPDTNRVDTATPYNMTLQVPRYPGDLGYDPGEAQSAVQSMSIDLQNGIRLSPGVVGPNGTSLGTCSTLQFKLWDQADPNQCPTNSQIGVVTVEANELGTLHGQLFLGSAYPRSAQQGGGVEMRAWLEASDAPGAPAGATRFRLKSYGDIVVDRTGELHASFDHLEPLPWRTLSVEFITADGRGVLANPDGCDASSNTEVTFSPWSSVGVPTAQPSEVTRYQSLSMSWDGKGTWCPAQRPFVPQLASAKLTATKLAVPTTMTLRMARAPYDDMLKSMVVHLPTGMYANLPGTLCDESQVEAHTCTEVIGTVTATVGFGDQVTSVAGQAYLAKPVGANLAQIVVALRDRVGPLDLGYTYVPMDVHLDSFLPFQASIHADNLPTNVDGIDVPIQALQIDINQPGFLTTPPMCGAWVFAVDFGSVDGASSSSQQTVPGCTAARTGSKAATPPHHAASPVLTAALPSTPITTVSASTRRSRRPTGSWARQRRPLRGHKGHRRARRPPSR